jgi:molybdate transport system regulatory protein
MVKQNKHNVLFKVWLEYKGEPLIGKGGAEILETIKEVKSISKAAKKAGMSYRYVWNYLAKLERRLGEPVVDTFKGGSKGGGGATLNELGTKLLNEYNKAEHYLTKVMREESHLDDDGLETGTRNRLNGTVQNVDDVSNNAKVTINIETPAVMTAIIPQKAVKKLGVKAGDSVEAVIKATDVWVAKEK